MTEFVLVFLGCIWFVGAVAHSALGGYHGAVEDALFLTSNTDNGSRDAIVVVCTVLWWLAAVVGAILMIVAVVGIAAERRFMSRSSPFSENDF